MKIEISLPVSEVARMAKMPVSTLYRWQKERPELFAIVIRGCLEIKMDSHR